MTKLFTDDEYDDEYLAAHICRRNQVQKYFRTHPVRVETKVFVGHGIGTLERYFIARVREISEDDKIWFDTECWASSSYVYGEGYVALGNIFVIEVVQDEAHENVLKCLAKL